MIQLEIHESHNGEPMYRNLSIQNLRCIRSLNLDRLARVNVLVGANSVGKTSVLEAIWLLRGAGNPELPMNIAVQRSGKPVLAPAPESHWLTLFPNLDIEFEIEISGMLSDSTRESLVVRGLSGVQLGGYLNSGNGKGQTTDPGTLGRISTTDVPRYAFQMSFTDQAGDETVSGFDVVKESARISPNPQVTRPAVLLSDRASSDATEIAALFSKCQDHGRIPAIVDGLRIVDPGISDLSLGYSIQENRPILYMHREGVEGRLPFDISGGGGRRVLEMLISILSEDAIPVMIDEFESGIYYDNLERVWQAVDLASQVSGCQLFLTTHSQECILAAINYFGSSASDEFRIYRLDARADHTKVFEYDYEVALAAAQGNLEIR